MNNNNYIQFSTIVRAFSRHFFNNKIDRYRRRRVNLRFKRIRDFRYSHYKHLLKSFNVVLKSYYRYC